MVGLAVVTAHDETQWRFDDPLDLLVEELTGALVEAIRLPQPLALDQPANLDARRGIAQHDQPPRLHEPDRRRTMRCLEDPLQDVGGDLVRSEAPDVATLRDRAIDRRSHVVGIAPAHRVGRPLGGPGVVESRRGRRADESVWGGHAREQ